MGNATVRVAVHGDGALGYRVADGRSVTGCSTWFELAATLEFVLARALVRHAGAAAQIHGAGVSVRGEGLLLVGPSGRGKSSLAIQLAREGYPLISDDFLFVHGGGRVGGVRRYAKLDLAALSALGIDPESTVHWHPSAGEAWIDPEGLSGWVREPSPVRWILFLGPSRSRDALRAVPAARVLELLLESRALDRHGDSLPVLTDLLHGAEAFELEAASHAAARALVLRLIAPNP